MHIIANNLESILFNLGRLLFRTKLYETNLPEFPFYPSSAYDFFSLTFASNFEEDKLHYIWKVTSLQ
jgi:hypothetical protein